MKSKIVLFSVLAVLALFAVSAVPSASALDNEVYFVPEDSYGLYCENIPVQIMVDAVDLTTGAGMDIYFDPDCVNITNVDFTGTPYNTLTGWTHGGNYVHIGVMGPMTPIRPGTHLIANLTLHCEKEAECMSDLAFTETELLDYDGDPLPNVIWHDGTFSCGVPCIPSIEVNKTVWDKESQAWVEVIAANLSDTVQFRCEMYNKGTCPLTNLVVTDTLSDSLEYTDNATVDGEPKEPEMLGPNEFRWEFPLLVLVPGQTITIEFDAHVIDYGYDCNVQNATAMCEEIEVSDEDTACVDVSNGEDNEVYFVPEDSNGRYCENISVQIMVDAVDLTTGAGMDIYFDPDCVNITNVDFTGTPYSTLTGWTHGGNYVHIGVMGPMTPIQPGTYLIANLTLHCENETTECSSDLLFTETELLDYNGDPLPNVIWYDGTFSCVSVPKLPDLTVTEITVNYDASSLGGRAIGPEPGLNVHTECNNLSAVIEEKNGVDVGSPFNVTFTVDVTTLCTVRVPGLTGGANKTLYCDCSWYPMAGDVFAINVTVDSNHEIPETNETNNTKWNNGTAVSNGYKGDGWQGPDMNLINEQCHDQDTINLTYSVGDSEYVSGLTVQVSKRLCCTCITPGTRAM
jgi:fimbrial isopeptide formation D2 family protein